MKYYFIFIIVIFKCGQRSNSLISDCNSLYLNDALFYAYFLFFVKLNMMFATKINWKLSLYKFYLRVRLRKFDTPNSTLGESHLMALEQWNVVLLYQFMNQRVI